MNLNSESTLFFNNFKSQLTKVREVSPSDIVLHRDVFQNNFKKNKKRKRKEIDKAISHLNELVKAAEEADHEFEERHLPYRFCIVEEGDEMFMDFALISEEPELLTQKKETTLDRKYSGCLNIFLKDGGHIETLSRKKISDKNFLDCLEMFKSGVGLLLNKRA